MPDAQFHAEKDHDPNAPVSLSEVHRTVRVDRSWPRWKRALAFIGPGYLVAVGYMDPGNWATSLAGGSRFGYTLLTVALASSLMAILLQSLSARLGIATGRDLAQACRDTYPRSVSYGLWILAELAIIATDIAEVIGTAIGLQLLLGWPLWLGIAVTSLDVFLILFLQRIGFRAVETVIIAILGVIAISFAIQIGLASPDWPQVLGGFVPRSEIVTNPDMLYLAIGILGATVMPHNLYLHSGLVQTRVLGDTIAEKQESLQFATLDSTIALLFALLVNASILILAAAAFNAKGRTDIVDLGQAHALLEPLLGSTLAPTLFALALIGCGLNSTVTATLAGQIVMEGFLRFKLPPALRRLITRVIAIVPAAIVSMIYGDTGATRLLVFSQVMLSLQLPFAVVPLVMMTAENRRMGALKAPLWVSLLAGGIAAVIIGLNVRLIWDVISAV